MRIDECVGGCAEPLKIVPIPNGMKLTARGIAVAAWFNQTMSSTELAVFLVCLIEAIAEHEGQPIAEAMTALLVALGG